MLRFIATALVTLTALLLVGCEKYELDRQMTELCKKDGGIKIFETVALPGSMFDSSDNVTSRFINKEGKNALVLADNYIETEEMMVLKQGEPLHGKGKLARVHTSIARIEDGKVLVEGVQYRRAGGDRFYVGHFTQASCPSGPLELSKKAFVRDTQEHVR